MGIVTAGGTSAIALTFAADFSTAAFVGVVGASFVASYMALPIQSIPSNTFGRKARVRAATLAGALHDQSDRPDWFEHNDQVLLAPLPAPVLT